jgi:hypothetical protein
MVMRDIYKCRYCGHVEGEVFRKPSECPDCGSEDSLSIILNGKIYMFLQNLLSMTTEENFQLAAEYAGMTDLTRDEVIKTLVDDENYFSYLPNKPAQRKLKEKVFLHILFLDLLRLII